MILKTSDNRLARRQLDCGHQPPFVIHPVAKGAHGEMNELEPETKRPQRA